MFRFTIRDVLRLTVVVALALGWLVDGITVRREADARITAADLQNDILHDEYVDLMNAIHDAGVRYRKQANGRYTVDILRDQSQNPPLQRTGPAKR